MYQELAVVDGISGRDPVLPVYFDESRLERASLHDLEGSNTWVAVCSEFESRVLGSASREKKEHMLPSIRTTAQRLVLYAARDNQQMTLPRWRSYRRRRGCAVIT